ncbi:MAG: flagellar biosynthesis protein FlhF, partial [Bdellovibrionales bacterium]|nr:flagellar biosynthesis protein FlhF [Bdellovibrionales bacterium]
MQVRKFEAKTMKEALEMVKRHLGRDAVILSARDNSKGFGLLGEKSYEVTAAISETTLKKKIYAERKLNEKLREKYATSSARNQKAFIDKVFEKQQGIVQAKESTKRRYIDIEDDYGESKTATIASPSQTVSAEERIKGAAARALKEAETVFQSEPKVIRRPARSTSPSANMESDEVLSLRKEILQLKKLISGFRQMPQNFVTRHPGAEHGISYEMSEAFQKLVRAGISLENVIEILKIAQNVIPFEKAKKPAIVDAWVAKYLLDQIQVSDPRQNRRVHIFVGPTGQGKTSSLIKYASQLAICDKKRIAILTSDSIKLGASEQLRIYAQILNVPFGILRRSEDWSIVLPKIADVDYVLVDSPGVNSKDFKELDVLKEFIPKNRENVLVHYVQSLMAKDSDAIEVAQNFKNIGVDDLVLTNLDQSAQHGFIYNFQQALDKPLHSFGIGPKIPEDY